VDVFEPVSRSVALGTSPIINPPRNNYYALGAFTLKRKGVGTAHRILLIP